MLDSDHGSLRSTSSDEDEDDNQGALNRILCWGSFRKKKIKSKLKLAAVVISNDGNTAQARAQASQWTLHADATTSNAQSIDTHDDAKNRYYRVAAMVPYILSCHPSSVIGEYEEVGWSCTGGGKMIDGTHIKLKSGEKVKCTVMLNNVSPAPAVSVPDNEAIFTTDEDFINDNTVPVNVNWPFPTNFNLKKPQGLLITCGLLLRVMGPLSRWILIRARSWDVTSQGVIAGAGAILHERMCILMEVFGSQTAIMILALLPTLDSRRMDSVRIEMGTTSSIRQLSFDDLKPWADDTGRNGVATAEDESIIHFVNVSLRGTWNLSFDLDNDLWVGGYGNQPWDLVKKRRL